MDLSFIFGLVLFLGAMWMYLLNALLALTVAHPADPLLMPLACLHFVVFVYLVLALAVLYSRGNSYLLGHIETPVKYTERFLIGTWPVTLVAVLASLSIARLDIKGGEKSFLFMFPTVAGVFFVLSCLVQRRQQARPQERWRTAVELTIQPLILGFACIPYVLVMSVVFSDVDIRLDKEVYEDGKVIVTVRRGGYVFCPTVKSLECGAICSSIQDGTYAIPLADIGTANYMMVEYEPQVISLRRRHFVDMRVVQPLNKKTAEQRHP